MAKLRAHQRAVLRSSQFALPKQRKYPVHDRSHAANAKARATQQYKKGNLSKSQMQQVHSKANAVLRTKHMADGGLVGPRSIKEINGAIIPPGAGETRPKTMPMITGTRGASGGMVKGPGGPREDKVPAMLSAGEYVLPAKTVKRLGKKKIDRMVLRRGGK